MGENVVIPGSRECQWECWLVLLPGRTESCQWSGVLVVVVVWCPAITGAQHHTTAQASDRPVHTPDLRPPPAPPLSQNVSQSSVSTNYKILDRIS